ncbi:hypothetical protein KCP69_03990 [Salmonella enterica subsp. enterica]|nr:hypothetical protein KCP69_03990 [Salmonella enterica subsp. enterica]
MRIKQLDGKVGDELKKSLDSKVKSPRLLGGKRHSATSPARAGKTPGDLKAKSH